MWHCFTNRRCRNSATEFNATNGLDQHAESDSADSGSKRGLVGVLIAAPANEFVHPLPANRKDYGLINRDIL